MTARAWSVDEAARLGPTLRRIDPALMKGGAAGPPSIWLQGDEPYLDVFMEVDGADLRWLQVTARGKSLTWDRATGRVTTGRTDELAVEDGRYPASKAVFDDAGQDAGMIAFVRRLLQAKPDEPLFGQALAVLPK